MDEAAHLRGDADGETFDARNGLPMNTVRHRAFHAHLFAIHPGCCASSRRTQLGRQGQPASETHHGRSRSLGCLRLKLPHDLGHSMLTPRGRVVVPDAAGSPAG
ncbi:HNH endonuclease [Streptomyces sp. NPDC005859]|uniref:HNH endonuclease n=1 Tax=Streptomyces sp. NPDC005859 TaxID=3157170 RepID=UPI0033CDF157